LQGFFVPSYALASPSSTSEMTERTRASWPVYALGALSAGAIVVAILVVGPATGSSSTVTRTATAAEGVVQSTVSGSGNLQASSQLDLGFKTGGVVSEIYVSQGQQVTEGRLLAELNPKSAEVTLEQSRATLQAAIASLAQVEEDAGETSSGSGSGSGSNATAVGKAAAVSRPATEPPSGSGRESTGSSSRGGSSSPSSSPSSSGTSKAPESQATREANIASARAAVQSDKLSVEGDEQALADTRLYAPKTGTIVSLTGEVGESVSAQGTTKASSASSSSGSGSSGSGSSATGASSSSDRSATGSSSATGGSSSASGSGSSSSAFAVLSDLASMQLVAPLSESEIGNVKVGQTATVTVEALSATKLAAHVAEVAILSTSNSGVVSYDVTFELDQMAPGLKPGMSATAEVVVKQAEGVNVPTSAISAGSVTVLRGSTRQRRRVVTGLAGDSSTIVLSGLRAGERVLLPTATGTGAGSLTSRLGRALGGGGGALGGGGGGLGGGGGAFFRGGG
jgi:multidrug efflux pump subunit AcrA (membrane-fusion protein)